MRLLLISTDRNLFTPKSPVSKRIAHFGAGWTIDCVVFSTRTHGMQHPYDVAPGIRAYPTNSRSRWLYIFDAIRMARSLPRPDVVGAQDPFETGLVAVLSLKKVPILIEAHTDFFSKAFARHSLLNRVRIGISKYVLARVVAINAVSENLRQGIVNRYKNIRHSTTLPLYVDTKTFAAITHSPNQQFEKTLLWVGRMEPEKRPLLALRSFISARRAGMNIGLIMVGDGSLRSLIEEHVRREGVGEYVTLPGWSTDLRPWYAVADVLLVTSSYEGYGMVIVEALSAGVPVLSTDVGIARDAGALIATEPYEKSLLAWLTAPQTRGRLLLATYKSEEEYIGLLRSCYGSVANIS